MIPRAYDGCKAPDGSRHLLWPAYYVGAVLLAVSYCVAATRLTGQLHFHLFWAGMALFFVPVTVRLCQSSVRRAERLALIAAIGIFDALPKYLRSPDHLVFYDELAHFRQSEVTIATGRLFEPNPLVPIARVYPGLHALTAMLADLSGITAFQLAVVLLVLLHIAALIGVFTLGEALGQSPRVAALAALLYSVNPGFLFFDAMYAYESMAIVFFIWSLCAICQVAAARRRGERIAWCAVSLVLGIACTITHHVSSYALLLAALLMSAISAVRLRRGTDRPGTTRALSAIALSLLAAILAWTIGIAQSVTAYLGPLARSFLADAVRLLQPHTAHRTLFAGSTTPAYERLAAFASPAIAGIGAVGGILLLLGAHRRQSTPALGLYALGLLYFASMPLMVTQGGSEAVRRSWSFTYVGLALLVAPVIPRCVRWRARERAGAIVRRRRLRALGVSTLLMIVLIGNTAMNTNEAYRFPGAVIYGSDTRTLTAEVLATVRWFHTTFGVERLVIADRGNALAFAAFGDAWTAPAWSGLPIWQLYLSSRPPDATLLRTLRKDGYQFLVIDDRMLSAVPRIGYYTTPGEPAIPGRTHLPPRQALERYERWPWAIKIYQTDTLAIYRINYDALPAVWPPGTRLPRTAAPIGADAGSPPRPP